MSKVGRPRKYPPLRCPNCHKEFGATVLQRHMRECPVTLKNQ